MSHAIFSYLISCMCIYIHDIVLLNGSSEDLCRHTQTSCDDSLVWTLYLSVALRGGNRPLCYSNVCTLQANILQNELPCIYKHDNYMTACTVCLILQANIGTTRLHVDRYKQTRQLTYKLTTPATRTPCLIRVFTHVSANTMHTASTTTRRTANYVTIHIS